MMPTKPLIWSVFTAGALLILFILTSAFTYADTVDELRQEIAERNAKIQDIEEDIQEYEEELQEIGREKRTLESTIDELDVSRRKIGADINLTENRIKSTELEIQKLNIEIGSKENDIEKSEAAIADTIRKINEVESDSLVEALLANEKLGDVWERVETLERFQSAMRTNIRTLLVLKEDFEGTKGETETKKRELLGFKDQLAGQKRVLDRNRGEKQDLLSVTESEESNYQQLLAERVAAREQFERELQELEAELEFTLDPSTLPPTGQGVLAPPLDSMFITQYFGNTPFARSGAYDGRGHNGLDLRASIGTPVKAPLGGTVIETGNTDRIPGCFSYGKWALVRHNNGLSTLYAHLSDINVDNGQSLSTGDIVGFSGNSGFSTGPHLHFTVYLSEGVQVVRLGDIKEITNCGAARIPIAPLAAYLNPLDYLRGIDI